jgi:hypothetical protein
MAIQSTRRSAANPYVTGGPSRYFQTRGGTSSIPVTGIRTGANVSVGGGKGGAPAAKGASAEAPKVPTGVEPGEPSAPEYNPIIDAETMSPPVDPNRQEAIANQARAPRFAIGNPGVGSIDLGSLLSAKPTEGFDPKAPIGGANVPFQETKGVGGYFRRLFGDTANEQNVAAQQAQAAEWKAEDTLAKQRQAKREDLDYEIAARNKESARQFDIEQKRLADKAIQDEIKGYDDEAVKLAREGNEAVLKDADMVRKERADADKLALEERKVKLAEDVANKARYRTIQTEKGGATVIDEHTGKPLRTYHPPTIGMITDPKTGKETAGNIPGRWEEHTERPKLPANLIGGGAQVNRADGNTFGGPLPPDAGAAVTPMRSALMPMDESNRPSQRMVPVQEEENIDPYQLQRTTPSMGTMVEPAGAAARRRARYLSPNMPGWSLGQ